MDSIFLRSNKERLLFENNRQGPFSPYGLSNLGCLLDSSAGKVYTDSAVRFISSDKAYLSIADNSTLSMGAGVDFTIAGWFYLDSLSLNQIIVLKGSSIGGTPSITEYTLYVGSDNKPVLAISNGTTSYTATWGSGLSTSTWYFFDATLNTTTGVLSLNINRGTAVTTSSVTYAQDSNGLFSVGGRPLADYFLNGRLDSFGIWKRVLTSTELDYLYNSGSGRMFSDLTTAHKVSMVSWWGFNEEDGIRYDSYGTNHLAQTFLNIIDNTSSLGTTELVTNGTDFTGGPPPTGWTESGSVATAVAGGQSGNCLQIANSGTAYGYAYQTITTVANQNYSLTLYFKKGTSITGLVYIGTTVAGEFLHAFPSDTNWTQKTYNFKATTTSTIIRLGNNTDTDTHTSLWDGISVKALTQTNLNGGFESLGTGETLSASELVSNPGFETAGTNGGTKSGTYTATVARSSNVATVTTSTAHGLVNGNVAIITSCTDTTYNSASATVTRVDDTTFTYANTGSDEGAKADTTGRVATDIFANWSDSTVAVFGDGYIEKETSSVHGGSNALKLTAGTTKNTICDIPSIAVSASTRYKLTFWTRGDGTYAGQFYIYDVSNSAVLTPLVSTGVTGTSYIQVTQYFTTPVGCTAIGLYFQCPSTATGVAYFDDVSIKAVTASNTFLNWSETYVAGNYGTITANTSSPYAGTNSLLYTVDATGTSIMQVSQNVLTVGNKYKVSAYVKASSGTPSITIGCGNTSSTQAITTSYVLYTAYLTCSSNSAVTVRPQSVAGSASKLFYVDDITVVGTEIGSAAGIASGLAIDGNLCASFNGSTQYLSKTNDAKLQTGDIDFTVWGWVNLSDKRLDQYIVNKYTSVGNLREYAITYDSTNDKFSFRVSPDGTTTGLTSIYDTALGSPAVNTWYFVVAWHDKTSNTINIKTNNGTTVSSAYSAGLTALTSSFLIGEIGGAAGAKLFGRVDGVGFIKRTLTASEITALFNLGKGVKYDGLPSTVSADSTLCFWNLDERSAGTGAVTRLDSTANDMDLTDTGQTPSGQGVNYFEGTVSKWYDQSGNSKNFIQITQSNKLSYVTNAQNLKPVLRGDGLTKSIYNSADLIGAGDVTVVAVIKSITAGGGSAGRIIENGKFYLNLSGNSFSTRSDGVTSVDSAVISHGTPYVVIVTRTSVGIINFYVNGAISGTANQNSGTPAAGSPTYIGNNSTGTRGFDGDIDEILIYNSILTTTQITILTNYERSKWGI